MMEMVVSRVSTRKVSQVTEELCGTEFSKSTVSELCKRLDPIATAGDNSLHARGRPVFESAGRWPRSLTRSDAGHRRKYGRTARDFGFMLGDTESEESWTDYFNWLKQRDLRDVNLIISEDHGGLVCSTVNSFKA